MNEHSIVGYTRLPRGVTKLIPRFAQSVEQMNVKPVVSAHKVMPRVRLPTQNDVCRNGSITTRQIARNMVESQMKRINELAKAKKKRRKQCKCNKRFGKLTRLLTSAHVPISLATSSPILQYISEFMCELMSILCLLFVMGLLIMCYLYSRPRKLTFMQRLFCFIFSYFFSDSCYDSDLF